MRLALLLVFVAQLAPALESVPKALYRQRRVALSERINHQAALLFAASETDYHYSFRQDNDFYYLSGWTQPGAVLLIVASRPDVPKYTNYKRPYSEILFLPEKPAGRSAGPVLSARTPGAAGIADVDRVESIALLGHELLRYGIQNLAEIYTSTLHPTPFATATLSWLQQAILRPGATQDLAPALNAMRAIKDSSELDLLKKAADASVAAHLAAMKALKPGFYEYQIAALMEYEFRKRGCERPAYASIAASGANAAFDHYTENSMKVKSGDLILLDVAGEYSMYASDVTRTLPVSGRYTDPQRQLYRLVRGAELAVIQAFHSGQSTRYGGSHALQDVYLSYLGSHQLAKFAKGGIGHFVGLNVHDGGETGAAFSAPLFPGSVFNIEPRIYLSAENIGIGIEDTFWVDPDGKLVNLTADLPVEPEDIERAMATPDLAYGSNVYANSPICRSSALFGAVFLSSTGRNVRINRSVF